MQVPLCGNHNQPMTWKEIPKKAGGTFWAWNCGRKDQNNNWCQYRVPKGTPGQALEPEPHKVPTPVQTPTTSPNLAPQRTLTTEQEQISRSVALKAAIDFYSGKTTTQEAVIDTAGRFLGFLTGKVTAPTPIPTFASQPAQSSQQTYVGVGTSVNNPNTNQYPKVPTYVVVNDNAPLPEEPPF